MISGAVRFARYAFPPNQLGYCGPADHGALFEYGINQIADGGLRALALEFDGAWPYLELIAHSAGQEPLDHDVVEAYWIGNHLLDRIEVGSIGHSLEDRFRRRAGISWDAISETVNSGGRPTHAFHVFCVYPWVGLMRTGAVEVPLRIIDQCRIRWGEVLAVDGDRATVASRPMVLEDDRLGLGESQLEEVVWAKEGHGFATDLAPGDLVSMHWGWVCETVDRPTMARLRRSTDEALTLANRFLARPRTGILV